MGKPEPTTTLYDRIGGERLESVIGEMYRRILADPELGPFFEQTSMDKLRRMQTEFFATALGGPVHYSGLDLAAAHRGRGIERRHLTRFTEHLLDALNEFDLDDLDTSDIVARIATYSNEILGESTSDG